MDTTATTSERTKRKGDAAAPASPPYLGLTDPDVIRALPDTDFEALRGAAVEAQRGLDSAAAEAESAAQAALDAFTVAPSSATVNERLITEQVARNAREAANAHAQQISALMMEGTRRSGHRELLDLRVRYDEQARHAVAAAALVDLIERFERDLREQMAALHDYHMERSQHVRRMNVLEEAHGARFSVHSPQGVPDAMGPINERLIERFGTQLNTNGVGRIHMSAWYPRGATYEIPTIDLRLRLTPSRNGA